MSERKQVWCVAWKDDDDEMQWCATRGGRAPRQNKLDAKTLCKNELAFPLNMERRVPTCPGCRAALGLEGRRAIALIYDDVYTGVIVRSSTRIRKAVTVKPEHVRQLIEELIEIERTL